MTTPIVTLTLNPALDLATTTPSVVPGPKLRCAAPRVDPGGGGVNVSRVLHRLGAEPRSIVAVGGVTGARLIEALAAEGLRAEPLTVAGETRQSLAVTAEDTGAQYRFVLPGAPWSAAEAETTLALMSEVVGPGAWLVVSGSLPPGLGPDFLIALNRMARAVGAEMALDTSGPGLIRAVAETDVPFGFLRLDGEEATELAGGTIAGREDLEALAVRLLEEGRADRLALSLGAEGTLAMNGQGGAFCRPPKVAVVSAIGAGDSFLAAAVLALARGVALSEAVADGVAAAAAAVLTEATELCDAEEVARMRARVTVTPL